MSPVDRPPLHLQTSVGQAVVIELEAMPGAAVVWSPAATPDGCVLTRTDSVPDGSGVGGPATQRFQLVCDRAGRQQLRFDLKRPWESVVRAVQRVEVDVR